MTLVSEDVLVDTILSLGLMICFYYGLTAFAAVWYFRRISRQLQFLLKGVAPLLGGVTLAASSSSSRSTPRTRSTAAAARSSASARCSCSASARWRWASS